MVVTDVLDSHSDSVLWSHQSLRETSGADQWDRFKSDFTGPFHWFPVATDLIACLNQKVDRVVKECSCNKLDSAYYQQTPKDDFSWNTYRYISRTRCMEFLGVFFNTENWHWQDLQMTKGLDGYMDQGTAKKTRYSILWNRNTLQHTLKQSSISTTFTHAIWLLLPIIIKYLLSADL